MIPLYYPAAGAIAVVLLSRFRPRSLTRGKRTRRVLVTGASGFLGRAVTAAFANDDYTLRATMRQRPVSPFPGKVELVRQPDLARSFDWLPLLKGVDTVIHLAGIENHRRRFSPDYYDRIHRRATARLAAAAARAGVRHFVYVSSIRAQCGFTADHALTERDMAAPIDAQGRSKLTAEEAVRSSAVPFTILRLVPVYGQGMKGSLAFLIRAAISHVPLPVKAFANRRSYLGIDNFISALRFVLRAPAAIGETYVVADPGIPPSTSDLIRTVRKALGRRHLLLSTPIRFAEAPMRMLRLGDVWDRYCGNLRVDPAKLIAAGWRPLHDTRAGIVSMVQKSDVARHSLTQPVAPQAPDRPRPEPG